MSPYSSPPSPTTSPSPSLSHTVRFHSAYPNVSFSTNLGPAALTFGAASSVFPFQQYRSQQALQAAGSVMFTRARARLMTAQPRQEAKVAFLPLWGGKRG
jgi:hypothetical protein